MSVVSSKCPGRRQYYLLRAVCYRETVVNRSQKNVIIELVNHYTTLYALQCFSH